MTYTFTLYHRWTTVGILHFRLEVDLLDFLSRVADVPEVELRQLHRHGRLQKASEQRHFRRFPLGAVAIHLVIVHGLLVHRAAQPIVLGLTAKGEGDLREELASSGCEPFKGIEIWALRPPFASHWPPKGSQMHVFLHKNPSSGSAGRASSTCSPPRRETSWRRDCKVIINISKGVYNIRPIICTSICNTTQYV